MTPEHGSKSEENCNLTSAKDLLQYKGMGTSHWEGKLNSVLVANKADGAQRKVKSRFHQFYQGFSTSKTQYPSAKVAT